MLKRQFIHFTFSLEKYFRIIKIYLSIFILTNKKPQSLIISLHDFAQGIPRINKENANHLLQSFRSLIGSFSGVDDCSL